MAVNLQTTENSTVYSSTQHSCELRPRRSGQRAAAYRVEGMDGGDGRRAAQYRYRQALERKLIEQQMARKID